MHHGAALLSGIVQPVFIVGCARSGTSILGELFAAHPRVAYCCELQMLWNGILPEGPDHRLTREDATPAAVEKARLGLAAIVRMPPGKIFVEKNPKHALRIPFLDAVFPDARFVHIIRDGRDAVASLMFRNRGPQWGHLQTPGWADLLARYPHDNHIRCAHQWRDAVAIARADARELSPDRSTEVRYEDLVRAPAEAMGRLLGFLGLDLAPEVLAMTQRVQDRTAGSYHAKAQSIHFVNDHATRIGRHRENLTPAQVADVVGVCGPLLSELGYTAA